MRLFSLDGTAYHDIQNMIELSQSNIEELNEVHKILVSPVKDFVPSEQRLLNQLQHLQAPLSQVHSFAKAGGVCSPEILNQMRQKIVFSGTLKEDSADDDEEGSQLSSPEMNCT